ncbi:MAG: NifB/NifX family molybdenum-iron cluster-binding protein [Nitrososphaeria archaeon]
MGKLRIAIPTKDELGLEDEVSEVFGRANTLTVLDVVDGKVVNVQIIKNPAITHKFGAGPIVAKMLADMKVDYVIAGQLGPGAAQLLKDNNIEHFLVNPGIKVDDAIKKLKQRLI